ncbi:MAG: hypothetical protein ACYTF7_08950, partial [Planctomycetota bacterium]
MDPLHLTLITSCVLLVCACVALAILARSNAGKLATSRQDLAEASVTHAQLVERHESLQQTLEQERARFESQNTQMREAFESLSNKALDRALNQLQQFAKESLSTQSTQARADLEQRKLAVEHLV